MGNHRHDNIEDPSFYYCAYTPTNTTKCVERSKAEIKKVATITILILRPVVRLLKDSKKNIYA